MQVRWVQVDTHEFWKQTSEAMKSPEAAHEWLARFRETILMSADNENPLPYAESLVIEAQGYIGIKSVARIRGYVKKNSPDMTDEEIDDFCAKKYGPKYKNAVEAIKNRKAIIEEKNENKTKSKSLSADSTAREDVENVSDGDNAATLESATSADTGTLDSLTDKDARPGDAVAEKPSRATPAKYPHGEFQNVKLTDDEYASWCAKAGPEAEQLIEELSSYIASKGVKYKSHYATLCSWLSKRKKDESNRPKTFKELDDERVNERMRRIFG